MSLAAVSSTVDRRLPPRKSGDVNNRDRVIDTVYVDFKTYLKDVLPNEW